MVIAAASLAVIAPPATQPAAAALAAVPLDASCSELNSMVGRPTNTYIVRQGIQFLSDPASRVGPGSDNRYSNGETIRIHVKLSLNVRWDVRDDLDPATRPLMIQYMLGDATKEAVATPAEGEGSNILIFEDTLDSDDTPDNRTFAANEVWIPENSVRANDRAFRFSKEGNFNTTGDGAPHQSISGPCGGADVEHPAVFHPQTAGSPTIISRPKIISEPHSGDTYYEGEKIWVRVEYSEPVTVSGTPAIKLRFGSDADASPTYKNARYVSAHAGNAQSLPNPPDDPRRRSSMHRLLFEYVVQSGDRDPDGFSIDWGQLSGGSIVAMDNGVAATRNHDDLAARVEAEAHQGGDPTVSKHLVDGSRGQKTSQELQDTRNPAFVSSYTTRVVSEPASGTTLHVGEYVVVRADFNEAVVVEDTRLELPIQIFNCYRADFNHRARLDNTTQGADGKTDRERYDDGLKEIGCLDSNGNQVNPETATDEHGNLKHMRFAKYLSGSGSNRLLFYYQITSQDKDRDGLIVPNGEFTYDGGKEITSSLQDSIITAYDDGTLYTHYSDVFEKPLAYQRANGQAVEGPPMITALTITSDPNSGDDDPLDYYEFGDTIEVQVTFNQGVVVTGTPLLTLNIGGELEDAEYTSGDGTRLLLFQYTVEAGDEDVNGISINRNSLKLGGGTLTALDDGEDASLDHRSLGNQSGHKVDAAAPTITRLRIASSPPNGGTYYGVDSHIDIEVTYDEAVTVAGTPELDFEVGTATKTAYYDQSASGADSNDRTIIFRYTVVSGDSDDNGIRVPDPDIVGGTITEVSQNPNPLPADRDHAALGTQSGHRVETIAPSVETITFVTSGSDCDASTLLFGEYICVAVTFDTDDDDGDLSDDGDVPRTGSARNRAAWVDTTSGTPSIELDVDGAAKDATYHSGSGSGNRLIFRYEVESGLTDSDGVSIDASDIRLNGGVITDTARNNALLQHGAIDDADGPNVDSVVPELSNLRITSSPPNSGDTYGRSDMISFAVDFDEDVVISGTPRLRFQIGDDDVTPANNNRNTQRAELSAGCAEADTGTCTLTFSYTVGPNDDDNDGISVDLNTTLPEPETTAITGTIRDRTGNSADLTHGSLSDDNGHKVDAQPPRVSKVEITSVGQRHNDTYKLGDAIIVQVTFDDPIELTLDDDVADLDDNPRIALRMRSGTKYAGYASGGDDTLTFRYVVEDGDLDLNGIGINASALRLQDATLTDPQGQNASLTHDAVPDADNQKVDGIAPTVTGVEVESDPPRTEAPYRNDKYGAYDSTSNDVPILVKVTFSESVKLSTGSSIDLTIGTTNRSATWVEPDGYSTTAGVRDAIFKYEVLSTDEDDNDGIDIVADSLTGTITDLVDNDASLAHGAQSNLANHKVDTTAPTVTSVEITSPSPEGDSTYENYYAEGDTIMVTVTFSERVAVNGTGVPTINLNVGGTPKVASFQPGDGTTDGDNTTKLMFSYVVVAGDMDSDGVSIDDGQTTSQIQLPTGSTITDLAGNEADLGHDALADDGEHKVNGDLTPRGPYATSISIFDGPDKLDTYRAGEHIFFDVTFSEAVAVSGTPMLPIVVGNQKEANYVSKPNASTLRFRYTVQGDDEDDDGVSVTSVSIDLNNGTIRATDDNTNALLGVPELATQTGHKVDGVAPSVSRDPYISSDPDDGINGDNDPLDTYEKDDVVEVTVTFDEGVVVSGTPYINIVVGTSTKRANRSGPATIDPATGSTTLSFSYTVRAGDKDINGVSIGSNQLFGTITDPVGNSADRSHSAMSDDAVHLVDGGPGGGGSGGGNNGGGGGGGFPASNDNDGGEGNPGIRVERIGGIDRFETAQLIAERYAREIADDESLPVNERKITTVIIASGRAFPDALTASALTTSPLSSIVLSSPALAGSKNAPLLLTEPHELPEFTKEFLVEFEIAHVYIVGGSAAVSTDVEAEISGLPSVVSVIRFGGADRYETSVAIASEVIANSDGAAEFCGTSLRTALLATGRDYADALALAPIAATGPHPLLLTHSEELPDSVRAYFVATLADGSIEQIIVAGGAGAVSEDVVNELTDLGFTVIRVGGVDRYDTSVRTARFALRSGVNGAGTCLDNNRVALATGLVYADGLAGGPLIARMDGATILVKPDEVPHLVDNFLAWHRLDHTDLTLTVFGGPAAISYEVVGMARESAKRGLRR
ncbi:cell wall-binding repeat-containing protein [Candidatus Poriferisodalis sp.]|uniref:cell wall-binding repeat-containing protein n=1 Tax=Candidatus Poriferisodalis sp. TaxID=3101277 RepID=UPI003B5926A7